MKITAIEPQKKNPGRVNVYLDGEFAFGLARIVAAWLTVGQELGEEKIAALQVEDEQETVYQKAVHFLNFRPRSSAEVRRNLIKRGVPDKLTEATLQRLLQAGLVNDEAFARAWVENRTAFRPRSRSALRLELRRKGLSDDTIQSVLEEQAEDETLALDAARRYAARLADLDWPAFRQKLGGFLGRRGFSYATIAPVVYAVWTELSRTEDGRDEIENEE